MQIPQDLNFV